MTPFLLCSFDVQSFAQSSGLLKPILRNPHRAFCRSSQCADSCCLIYSKKNSFILKFHVYFILAINVMLYFSSLNVIINIWLFLTISHSFSKCKIQKNLPHFYFVLALVLSCSFVIRFFIFFSAIEDDLWLFLIPAGLAQFWVYPLTFTHSAQHSDTRNLWY